MNTETGELKRIDEKSAKALGFIPVPEELEEEANKELGDKNSVMVDMSKDSMLVRWAKETEKNKKNKKRIRNKMAKKSRKINRER